MSARGQVVGALLVAALTACASAPPAARPPIPPPVKPVPPPDPPPDPSGEGTRVKREVQDPIRLAILKLESDGAPALGIAGRLTPMLCMQAHEDDAVKLDGCGNRELVDEKLMGGCENESTDCMVQIAKQLGATQLVYGRVDASGSGFRVSLKLVEVDSRILKSWTGTVAAHDPSLQAAARDGYAGLVGKVR